MTKTKAEIFAETIECFQSTIRELEADIDRSKGTIADSNMIILRYGLPVLFSYHHKETGTEVSIDRITIASRASRFTRESAASLVRQLGENYSTMYWRDAALAEIEKNREHIVTFTEMCAANGFAPAS